MSRLKNIREQQNLTQEELASKTGVSVRTIQRIESGTEPKGYTLRVLAVTLGIDEKELLNPKVEVNNSNEKPMPSEGHASINYSLVKLINLSSLLFVILPPLNIISPLVLMFALKQKNTIVKQIISLQIMWTIIAPILFMLGILMKFGRRFTLILMITLVLSNVCIILRNALQIDKSKDLYYRLNFNMI
ncbi:MAG: helix-turn-helix domain-containing protein [Phycisphaerales bacterium]